jgi:hypothetical protein
VRIKKTRTPQQNAEEFCPVPGIGQISNPL